MKSKVTLSKLCTGMTVAAMAILIVIATSINEMPDPIIFIIIIIGILFSCLFYAPTYIEATETELIIHRVLKNKVIPYNQITEAERCVPSTGGLRLCGSGGLFGYWGYFNDIIIGSYFGYFGNKDQCILLKLKGGKKYVISCENPNVMLQEISKNLK